MEPEKVEELKGTQFSGVLTLALLASSATLWIGIIQRWRRGEPILPARFRSLKVRVPKLAVGLMVIYLGISLVAIAGSHGKTVDVLSPDVAHNMLLAVLIDGVVTIPLMLMALLGGQHSQADVVRLGFRSDDIWGQLRDGFRGFLAAALPVTLVLLATSPLRSDENLHPFLRILNDEGHTRERLLILLTAGILAPLKEELLFRVVLQNWLTQYFPAAFAIVFTSVVFGAIHGYPDCFPIAVLSLVLGIVYHRRRSYLAVVTLHGLFNGYNLLATMLSGGA
ncbi:CPBP family intramembrane glutamic endopeptidase [Planctomicrobium piriforme]|uniref:CAAX protease self-immunity n=1 Tax=Planctomicrobium piriforme TaxID=1576369 RepID=A0A1I3K377_9PLAN|nr:CPBP family intramembrane glutamic endopeptidase [Planctomicrobium piriforme]SFI66655.1 CAAX protease self-immunity [Planctomicrobium piriforme]